MASLGANVAITDINESGLLETITLCGHAASEGSETKHMLATLDAGLTEKCN